MTNYAVLGLGLMGEAIVYDVLTHDNTSKVYGFELSENRRSHMKDKFSNFGDRFETYHLELNTSVRFDESPFVSQLVNNEVTIVFGAIDYKFNIYLTKLCIHVKANFLDLGGNPDIVRSQQKLNDEAKNAGITVIPDLGLAPGMANILTAHIMKKFDKLDECHIRVGGLPQPEYKKSILNYQQLFSIRGLTNEYLEDAIVIRDGKIEKVKSMSDVEKIMFDEPYGWLEAFQTGGGTSSLPELFEGKITNLTYKTLRYPGHVQFFQFLIEYELLSSEENENLNNVNPREVIEFYLQKNLPKGDPDAALMRITVIGTLAGTNKMILYDMIDHFDTETKFTAMARTTAFPTSIVGQMIANGVINEKGVLRSETGVPGKEFLDALKVRNIDIKISESKID